MKPTTLLLSALLTCNLAFGQSNIQDVIKMQIAPKLYAVQKTNLPIAIDGKDNDEAWKTIPFYTNFEDIEGPSKKAPTYETKIKMLWDNENLYIYAQLVEPHIWGDITKHDAIIYHNNDFEVFIKPTENHPSYFEIEVNSLNTIMDLLMTKPYRFGGEAMLHWDLKGLKSAVHIEGTNNSPNDIDKYWAVEMAIPFTSLQSFGRRARPENGDYWRINFSRVQWQHEIINGKYRRKEIDGKRLPEDNWVWQPIGLIDIHLPEQWGFLQFVENSTSKASLPKSYPLERFTWNMFYLQKIYRQKHQHYANTSKELHTISSIFDKDFTRYNYEITTNKQQNFYRIEIKDQEHHLTTSIDSNGNYTIRHDK